MASRASRRLDSALTRSLLSVVLVFAAASAQAQSASALCTPSAQTLCLDAGRFSALTTFQSASGSPSLNAKAVSLTDASGYFWFFDSTNVEMIVKVLDGCAVNGAYWVFAAGLTNVGVHLVVTDLSTGLQKPYDNAVGAPFQPIQDTGAFHTCP